MKLNLVPSVVLLVAIALQLAAMKFMPEAKDPIAFQGLIVQASVGQLASSKQVPENQEEPSK